ncbi:MAG TPA: ATPase domain-containing protein [Acidimicrobiales bacterium]
MTDRLPSGVHRLDDVFGGGLPANSITLVAGAPGTGKTILAEHYVFHNAHADRPALYCTTVSEPLDKLLRYGQSLDLFDPEAIGTAVLFEDLGGPLHDGGLDAVLERLAKLIREHRPSLVVIDSFKAFRAFADDDGAYRRFVHGVAGMLSAIAVSAFLLGEYTEADVGAAAEFAVADNVVFMALAQTGPRSRRVLEVLKMRGSDFASGEHGYRISRHGIEVYPRIADPLDPSVYDPEPVRIPSGIAALDELLQDGYWRGATTLVAGPTGSGKTLMGLHFIYGGIAAGERGIFATLQESRSQLNRVAPGFGWSLDDEGMILNSASPVDIQIDQWLHDLFEQVESTGARRLVIDSLSDLATAAGEAQRYREYLYSLVQRCARRQINLLMTQEITELFGTSQLSDFGVSHLSDNVIMLQYVPDKGRLRRGLTVLKARASSHDVGTHEFTIDERGIVLAGPLDVER